MISISTDLLTADERTIAEQENRLIGSDITSFALMTSEVAIDRLAQSAYHAYGSTTDYLNYSGLPMPEWKDLPEKIHRAWYTAIAQSLSDIGYFHGSFTDVDKQSAYLSRSDKPFIPFVPKA